MSCGLHHATDRHTRLLPMPAGEHREGLHGDVVSVLDLPRPTQVNVHPHGIQVPLVERLRRNLEGEWQSVAPSHGSWPKSLPRHDLRGGIGTRDVLDFDHHLGWRTRRRIRRELDVAVNDAVLWQRALRPVRYRVG